MDDNEEGTLGGTRMIQSVLNPSIWGISFNQKLFAESAQEVSGFSGNSDSFAPDQDLLNGTVGMLQSRSGIQANLSVFRANDEMLGTLLNTFA